MEALENVFKIYIITSDRDFNGKDVYQGVLINDWNDYSLHSKVFYASPDHLSFWTFKKLIQEVRPDTIYLNSMWSIPFTLYPLWIIKQYHYCKVVLAPRGMLKSSALEIKSLKKVITLEFMKQFIVPGDLIFHASEDEEKHSIEVQFKNPVFLVSNFTGKLMPFKTLIKKPGHLDILCVSRLHPIKNILFIIETFKNFFITGQIRFSIYGPSEDVNYVYQCKEIATRVSNNIEIIFGGEVNHNQVHSLIQAHHFFILPTLGENFGHSIFESFAAGRPVIISNKTPWLALENKHIGFDLPLNRPDVWINTLQRCVNMGQTEFDHWCRQALTFATNYTKSSTLKEQYIQLFS